MTKMRVKVLLSNPGVDWRFVECFYVRSNDDIIVDGAGALRLNLLQGDVRILAPGRWVNVEGEVINAAE